MASWRVVPVTLALVAMVGCMGPKGTPGAPPKSFEYHVAPPDSLLISVRPAPEINREVVVRPDGKISFDLIGEVEVQGKSIKEIQREITSRIEQFIVHPDVTVILSASNSRHYYMFGEVNRPGAYPLIGQVDVLKAVATAGGPTRFAAQNNTRLVRPTEGGDLQYVVALKSVSLTGDATTNYQLQPGDVVYVPPNVFAQVGYAVGVIFFPIQQLIGLGGRAVSVFM